MHDELIVTLLFLSTTENVFGLFSFFNFYCCCLLFVQKLKVGHQAKIDWWPPIGNGRYFYIHPHTHIIDLLTSL